MDFNTQITHIDEQRINSRSIAGITGKNHKDVMKAMHVMEPAREEVGERKFALSSYKGANNQGYKKYRPGKFFPRLLQTKYFNRHRFVPSSYKNTDNQDYIFCPAQI